jgi:hypothetical protein
MDKSRTNSALLVVLQQSEPNPLHRQIATSLAAEGHLASQDGGYTQVAAGPARRRRRRANSTTTSALPSAPPDQRADDLTVPHASPPWPRRQ